MVKDLQQQHNTTPYGTVSYPDATKLLRPQSIKGPGVFVVIVLAIIAMVIGGIMVYKAADSIYFSEVRKADTIQKNLELDSPYDFPQIKDYIASSNALDVLSALNSKYTMVPLASEAESASGFDYFKLPENATKDEGIAALKKGIGGMDILAASKLLNGGWRITMDLANYQDLKIRYCDLKATSIEGAILNAIHTQGFDGDNCEMTKEGVDESGNTFKSGTIELDDETYFWRVSALKFNDAYSISGLPDNAVYVGIRMTN